MVTLGVGKNMVRSIRFWTQATRVAAADKRKGGAVLTAFGQKLLGAGGLDPFLESLQTLWLIHWKLSTNVLEPLLAWDYLLNRWQEPELVRTAIVQALHKEALLSDPGLSLVTIEQHFETFLHTYVPTRGRKREIQEDNLDCPLVELELVIKTADRDPAVSGGRREPIYAFRREEKPEISPELFLYCLYDFWQARHSSNGTLTLNQIAHGHGSPGQVFKLPEHDVRERIDQLERLSKGALAYQESATIQQVRRQRQLDEFQLLAEVYRLEEAYA